MYYFFGKKSHPWFFKLFLSSTFIDDRSGWSRGSVPSSHARGQRFEPQRRQYFQTTAWPRRFFTPTPAESYLFLNPAFWLSSSRPFNRWPSVWFGSMLCGISMWLHGHEGASNDGNPSHPPLHFLPTFFARWRPSGSHQLLGTPSNNFYTQHSSLWSPGPLQA